MDQVAGIPAGLAAVLREGVVVLGPDGTVVWANDAAERLMGEADGGLIGIAAFDRVHPDELARAADGIAFAIANPERTAVVPFRLQRGDGTWVDVELMSSVISGDDGDHIMIVLRDASNRRAVQQAVASVAAGRPIEDTAEWLGAAIEARWPGTVAAVVLEDRGGRRLLGATRWPASLHAVVAAPASGADPVGDGLRSGEVTVRTDDELPHDVRDAAAGHGYRTFAMAPVPDPGGASVALVAWFDEPDAAHLEFEHASIELREVLALALDRRHHLARLDHAVHHDGLTGLLNRVGFVHAAERLRERIEPAGRAALLYIDLDGFKPVNDRYGHAVGDAVLRVVAGRLAAVAGPDCDVARIGGDEFVVLLHDHDAVEDRAATLAGEIVATIGAPIEVAGGDGELVAVGIGASVGVAVTEPGGAVDRLLELADGAMYSVKASGGSAWSLRLP